MSEDQLQALLQTVAEHIAREDVRDTQRDVLFARFDTTLAQLSAEHAEMLRDWRELQAVKQRRRELWDKVRTSVAGWIVVAIIGWLVSIGVAAAVKSGLVPTWVSGSRG